MLDVIIVGAGVSGISAACYLRRECPDSRFQILEARDDLGGTWDLFRYPGIRSDSDMHTFGFAFKPWRSPKALADGPSILAYLNETVDEYGVRDHIRFGVRAVAADWDSARDSWNVTVQQADGSRDKVEGRLLFMCSGYYDYASGHTPAFPGREDFRGDWVHPQRWPRELDHRGKRVAVIGSGATAVTLVPAMAETAQNVTIVQRSPTYIVSRPRIDPFASLLMRVLPEALAYRIVRFRNIRLQRYFYRRARAKPEATRRHLMKLLRKDLDPRFDIERHFTPRYNPWDQRVCLVPDADLFKAMNAGKVDVVTGEIETITPNGVRMKSGEEIPADIIVSATGLRLQLLGNVQFTQDGTPIRFNEHFLYHGMMFSGVANLIMTFGYVNASWTLRADLNSHFVCALLKTMKQRGATRCVPQLRPEESGMPARDWIVDFTPEYIRRAIDQFPRQGDDAPWRNTQDYLLDRKLLKRDILSDGVLQFSGGSHQGGRQPTG